MSPRISGFTLIRNGERFDYPYLESLRSLESLVDELVINVGIGDDLTIDRIRQFAAEVQARVGFEKVRIFESDWQLDKPEKKRSGLILSEQTNLALEKCSGEWCVYLQADEIFHEVDLAKIRLAIDTLSTDIEVEGLLFDYVHFYGSYDVVQESRSAYRREVRAFKRSSGARSIGDAQSFRKADNSKLRVVRCGARVFHYGWVRTPEAMREKTFFMDQLYHGTPTNEDAAKIKPHTGENFRYKRFWGLRSYFGNHPAVMLDRIQKKGWHWDLANSDFVWIAKDVIKISLDLFEWITGRRLFEYRSYRLIPRPLKPVTDQIFPEASVILSTFEMPRHLELVLEGLSRQSFLNFEIIICDDGSGLETRRVIERFRDQVSFRVEHVWQEHKGFRKCRMLNEGLRRSRGRTLIFLDGDCLPHRDFVLDHVQQSETGRYLAGRRVELGEVFSRTIATGDVRSGLFDFPTGRLLRSFISGDSDYLNRCIRVTPRWLRKLLKMDRVADLKGCNYSVSREVLFAINGFDEAYEGYGREDTDAELRFKNAGLRIKSLKGLAIQFHIWHPRRAFTPANENLLDEVKRTRRVRCERGLEQIES